MSGSSNFNAMAVNFGKAIRIIKELIPPEHTGHLITAFEELRRDEKLVMELKKIHHMLHDLETHLAVFEVPIRTAERLHKTFDFDHIAENWRMAVWPRIRDMRHFASDEMLFLQPRLVIAGSEVISGPEWIVDLLLISYQMGEQFRVNASERNEKEISKLSHTLLDTCRDQLFSVDRHLLEAVDQLDHLTDQFMRAMDHDGKAS